ncbi:MAG: hypothetical protein JJU19_14275, partial [Pararhodobacter sp.]|nr:hypothetical protein [Pararhodobacter sp.]
MTGNQTAGRAVQLADGGMLVVYAEQIRPDPDVFSFDYAIKTQRFDSAGSRLGGPQTITELPDTTNVSFSPVATGLAGGGYAIAWRDDGSNHLRIQTFDADGALLRDAQSPLPNRTITNAVGNEVSVEVFASSQPPALTGLETGGFAVTWNATYPGFLAQYAGAATMYTQAFDQDGQAVSAPVQITNWIASVSFSQDRMNWIEDSAPLADGNYVVVFRAGDNHPDNPADRPGIMARIFDDTGTPVTANFLVNEELGWRKAAPSVDTLADGSFVVAWVDAGNFGPESATYWRRFDADGSPVTDEESLGARHSYVTVAALDDGGFMLVLSNVPGTGSPIGRTSAQRFDADNNAVGEIVNFADARADLGMSFLRSKADIVPLQDGPMMGVWNAEAFSGDGTGSNVILRPFAPDLLGTTGDDVLEAGDIGTALFGFAGDDTLIGGPGDDSLTGGPGDDLLLGGGGTNTAVFSGFVSEYEITRGTGDRLVVTDLREGSPDGTDTLENIDILQFARRHATDTTNIVEVADLDLDVTLAVMVIDRRGAMLEDVAVTFTPDEGAAQGGATDAAGTLML